jgi:hypothetical protein
MIKSDAKTCFLNVLGFILESSTFTNSDGTGTVAASLEFRVPTNLFAGSPVWIAMWSLRNSSNRLYPRRLLTPEMKILLPFLG